ncbi:MAG: PIG-L deacetylase family protein [Promethearchaeota archaeon]
MKKVIMAIGAHADDITIWAGGILKKLTNEGKRLICVRITDDYADCKGLTPREAIYINKIEAEKAYRILGAEKTIHLEYPTDTLAGVDYLKLREKLIYLIRKYHPDIVISFDMNFLNEENMDHIITARAVNEACWQSAVENFHKEQLERGLGIHMVGERYLFARNPTIINYRVDISKFIRDKINAICQHKTILKNFFYQQKLIARANGLHIDILEKDISNELRVKLMVRTIFGQIGKEFGVKYGEIFNRINAGFLKNLVELKL